LRWEKDDLLLSNLKKRLVDLELHAILLEEVVTHANLLAFCLEERVEWVFVQSDTCDLVDLASTPICHDEPFEEEAIE